MSHNDLAGIYITNGVNESGEPFLTVACHASDGRIMLGQLGPAEVRRLALHWLGAAEAAEQDAAVLRCFRKLELPDTLAGGVITELRESRTDD